MPKVPVKKPVPHAFALELLERMEPVTRPMFGCIAVYIGEKIVLILRDRPDERRDNGVWIATTPDNHESLRRELPAMRSIGVLGGRITGWQNLPADSPDFEELVERACKLVLKEDPRIGKVPKAKKRSKR